LEVFFCDKNIHDTFSLTIDDAIEFFSSQNGNKIVNKLQPLQDVGLGYVRQFLHPIWRRSTTNQASLVLG
jgi:excinuclease ABC subunit A